MDTTVFKAAPAQNTSTNPRTLIHQRVAGAINDEVRVIAERTLATTGGRCTYSWSSDSIRLEYQGDTTDSSGADAYGKTIRLYGVRERGGDTRWTKTSPLKSESGTGLINLGWQHFDGCTDPLVLAKVEIWHQLSAPELGLVDFVVSNHSSSRTMPGNIRERLTLRLEEILEQLVLSNPAMQDTSDTERAAGGLDLKEVAEGTNVVGWAVKALEASISNTLRRIGKNEPVLANWDDAPDSENTSGLTQFALDESHLGASAEKQFEDDRLTEVSDEYVEHAARKRGQERVIYDANMLHRATELPFLKVPSVPTRKALLAEMDENPSLPERSLKAYCDLVAGNPTPEQLNISDDWLNLWAKYDADGAFRLLGIATAHSKAPALIVQAAIGFLDPLTSTMQSQMVRALGKRNRTPRWRSLSRVAVTAFDRMRTSGDTNGWRIAAQDLVDSVGSPFADIEALSDALEDMMTPPRRDA